MKNTKEKKMKRFKLAFENGQVVDIIGRNWKDAVENYLKSSEMSPVDIKDIKEWT